MFSYAGLSQFSDLNKQRVPDMGPFTVQVDQSRTPRARRGEYPPAGPVAEGAGDGLRAAEPDKVCSADLWCASHDCAKLTSQSRPSLQGGAKKRVFLVLSGLVVLAAVICGIGYLVFIRDTGDSTSSTASEGGTLEVVAVRVATVAIFSTSCEVGSCWMHEASAVKYHVLDP